MSPSGNAGGSRPRRQLWVSDACCCLSHRPTGACAEGQDAGTGWAFQVTCPVGYGHTRDRSTLAPSGVWAAGDGGTCRGWVIAALVTLQGTGRCTVASLVATGQCAGAAGGEGRPGAPGGGEGARPRSGSDHSLSRALTSRLLALWIRGGSAVTSAVTSEPARGRADGPRQQGPESVSAPRPDGTLPGGSDQHCQRLALRLPRIPSWDPRGLSSRDAGQQLRTQRPRKETLLTRPVSPRALWVSWMRLGFEFWGWFIRQARLCFKKGNPFPSFCPGVGRVFTTAGLGLAQAGLAQGCLR